MKTIIEVRKIAGELLAGGRSFPLLELHPAKHSDLPFWMGGDAFQFYVVGDDGYARRITVGKQAYVIIPSLEEASVEVKFLVEQEQGEERLTGN